MILKEVMTITSKICIGQGHVQHRMAALHKQKS